MHRIQRWAETHFRSAQLWEVGAYILACHHDQDTLCEMLRVQIVHLKRFEEYKDTAEQKALAGSALDPHSGAELPSGGHGDTTHISMDELKINERGEMDNPQMMTDESFENLLDKLHN